MIKIRTFISVTVLFILAIPVFCQAENFNRYTDELTQTLESDSLSVMTSGYTYETESNLCTRISGPTGQEFKTEYSAWKIRNEEYISGAARAINEIGNRFIPDGGETAKQRYFHGALKAMVNASMQRVSSELGGANLDNNIAPSAQVCLFFAKTLRDGIVDFKNIPEETQALLPFIKRTKTP